MILLRFQFFAFLFLLSSHVFSQTWQWATIESGTSGEGFTVSKDPFNNSILVATINGTAVIGSTTFTNSGQRTLCIKYDPNGVLLWTLPIENFGQSACGAATDQLGNIYLTTSIFGTFAIGSYSCQSSGTWDGLLMKISPQGNIIWVKNFGGSGGENPTAITVDAVGNSYVCGQTNSQSMQIGTVTLTGTQTTIFVAKFDNTGQGLWVAGASGGGVPRVTSISLDALGNSFITGTYGGSIAAPTTTIISQGSSDPYIAKYSPSGTLLFFQTIGGLGQEGANAIEVNSSGEVYVTGYHIGSNCAISSTVLPFAGNQDAWVAKYSNNGQGIWARQFGSSGTEIGYALAPYSGGTFLSMAAITSTIVFPSISQTIAAGSDGLGIIQLDNSGNVIFATSLMGGGDDVMDIYQINDCAVVIGGDILTPTIQVGNSTVIHPNNLESLFIAKLLFPGSGPTISVAGNVSLCPGGSTTLTATGATNFTWSTGATTQSIVLSPSSNTVINITGSSSQLVCMSSIAISIMIDNSQIAISVLPSNTVCAAKIVTLQTASSSSYSWSVGSNSPVLQYAVNN